MQSSSISSKTSEPALELLAEDEFGTEYIGKIKSKEEVGHCSYSLWENKLVRGASKPRLVLFLIHDLYDSAIRYKKFFEYLKEHVDGPLTLVGIDLVGMGMSSGHRGYVSTFDSYCLDTQVVINSVLKRYQKNVVSVMTGIGLGGLVTLRLLEQYNHGLSKEFDGIILVNPLIRPTFRIPNPFDINLLKLIPRYDRKRFDLPYRGIDLCDNLELASFFDSDVNIQKFLTLSKANEIFETARKVRAAAYFINTPTLILSSESPINDHEVISLFHKGLNNKQSRHIFFKFCSHELMLGRRQNKAFKLISNWLDTGYVNDQ